MTKRKAEVMRDYRAKAAKRGLVQRCVMIPAECRDRFDAYVRKLKKEYIISQADRFKKESEDSK